MKRKFTKIMGRLSKFSFGKYKGCQLHSVIDIDPTYVHWCLANVKWFSISDNAYRQLKNTIKKSLPHNKPSNYNDYGYYMNEEDDALMAEAHGLYEYGT